MKTLKVPLKKIMISKACLVFFVLVFFLSSCRLSSIKFNSIPQPSPTAKLRIYVVAVTSGTPPGNFWKVPHEEYVKNMTRQTARMLENRGIYEVVPASDVQTVLGPRKIADWEWMDNHWAFAKDAGRALHADYVLCIERSFKLHLQQDMSLINLRTGEKFSVSNYLPKHLANDQTAAAMIAVNYRTIFQSAQRDLLKTAFNKGRAASAETRPVDSGKKEGGVQQPATERPHVTAKKEFAEEPKDIVAAKVKSKEKQLTAEEKQIAFEKEMETVMTVHNTKQKGPHIVVYDFDSAENLRIVGSILTESLREELYKLGGFVLINRENMAQVMDELKLHQSGLINEKQAIKLGQWMAAQEAVTGNFAVLGSLSVLQAKRIDIKTMGTISLSSLKCKAGAEDELLTNMPELARKLTQLQKQQ